LYCSSGIGVSVGPFFLPKLVSDTDKSNRNMIVLGLFALTTGMLFMPLATHIAVFAALNVWRTFGSGLVWAYSSSLLQRVLPNDISGRVFAFEWAVLTVATVLSRLSAGLLMDVMHLSPDKTTVVFGIIGAILCVIWTFYINKRNTMEASGISS